MSATTHIRFRGDKKDTWAVSALNQIGPDDQAEIVYRTTNLEYESSSVDTGYDETYDVYIFPPDSSIIDDQFNGMTVYSQQGDVYSEIVDTVNDGVGGVHVYTVSVLPAAFEDGTVKIYALPSAFVAKSGNDSSSGLTPWSPKLTIQAAIDAAVSEGITRVEVLDSGTYEERLDLKGITVEAASGQTPTILFPFTPFTESASGITAAVRQTAEYTINGTPCLYAAAADGLYRSTDGKNWSKVLFSGHALAGVCVWNNECYVFSNTDKNLYKISDAGSSSVFASGATTGLSGSTVNGGLFAIGSIALYVSVGDIGIFSVWYNGSAWEIDTTVGSTGVLKDLIYDPIVSKDYAYGYSLGTNYRLVVIDVSTIEKKVYPSIKPTFITSNNGKIFISSADGGVFTLDSPSYPELWTLYSNIITPTSFSFDKYGYIIANIGAYCFISKDGLLSHEKFTYSANAGTVRKNFYGIEVIAKSTGFIVWDRRHVTNTIESSILSGCVLDGQDMAVDAYAGTVSLQNCIVRRHYQPCEDVAVSVNHQYTRFEDMQDSSFRGSSVIDCIIDMCEFARFTGAAIRITGPGVSVEECTIAASGRGLRLEAVPKSVSGCIISGNTVDIDSAVSGAVIEDTCLETRAGLPLIETGCIIGNPLFVNDTNDLRLKSRALGYAADSALLDDVDSGSGVDMRESIGARRYSRVLSSSSYGLDYMLHCNPGTVRNAYRPANYDKAYSQNGSMYGRETNPSAHKLARTLSWDSTGGEDAKTKAQAAMLRYIYGLDSVFDVGDSTDGTDFVPRRTGSKVSTFNRVSFGTTDPLIAPNEHAGAWCIDETGTIIGRIDSHTASYLSSGVYVIDITWQSGTDLPTATSVCKIDAFRRFRIDKTQPFSPVCQMPYVPGIISDIPTQYDITLEEVDE
jgi:hypothetical protein